MAAPSQLRLEGDLPAVPSADLEPAWDKEVSPSNAAVFKEFVKWVRAEELPETPDAGLVKFIHSCDYDIKKAQKCAKDFYSSREDNSELFANWDISLPNFQSILDVIGVAIVPRRTPTNCRVVINSLKTSDTTNYVIADVCKVTLMVIESIFLTEPTIDGIIVIHDLEKITFSHFIKMLWSMPRKIQTYFQDGIPIKRDRVHLINCPSLIDRGLQLMRHLGRKEDWDKLRVYKGDDFSELHSYVPPDCLPSELGGTVATLGELQAMTIQRLQDFKDIFRKSLLEEL